MIETDIKYPVRIYLEDIEIDSNDYTVTATIIDEMGQTVSDKDKNLLENKVCTLDASRKLFYIEFQLDTNTKGKYFRCCFDITKDNHYIISGGALVDFTINRTRTNIQLIPYEYYRDYVLNGELSDDLKRILITYPRDGIMEWLNQGMHELELELEMCFTKKSIDTEIHDFFCDNLREIHFMIQLYEYPIISVEKYHMYYSTEKICEFPPEELIVDKKMGTVEFLPTSTSPFFVYYQASLEASQVALFARGSGTGRLPAVFHIGYTYGLDFMNLDEYKQSDIRMAICRRALINSLGRLSKDILISSESSGVDGMSYSEGHAGLPYLSLLREMEQKWIEKMKLDYNKHYKIMIA